MDKEQAAQITVALVAELDLGDSPLAVKFAPYLQDRVSSDESSQADIDILTKQCRSFVMGAHAEAIARLRDELTNDPFKIGYVGMNVQEIQNALMQSRPVCADGVLVTVGTPPVGRIWQGIPYARNLPSLDNIAEAQK